MQLAEFYLTGTGVEWNPEMAVFYLSQCPNQEDNIRTSFSLVERSRLSELCVWSERDWANFLPANVLNHIINGALTAPSPTAQVGISNGIRF
eukprot:m.263709 g.263709  ORF g.263709 m.263709 type:complete len:92 (-) comp16012_c0_seq7:457-732(-)